MEMKREERPTVTTTVVGFKESISRKSIVREPSKSIKKSYSQKKQIFDLVNHKRAMIENNKLKWEKKYVDNYESLLQN